MRATQRRLQALARLEGAGLAAFLSNYYPLETLQSSYNMLLLLDFNYLIQVIEKNSFDFQGDQGFEAHVDRMFQLTEHFTSQARSTPGFEILFKVFITFFINDLKKRMKSEEPILSLCENLNL